jgi:hypothetical protein
VSTASIINVEEAKIVARIEVPIFCSMRSLELRRIGLKEPSLSSFLSLNYP